MVLKSIQPPAPRPLNCKLRTHHHLANMPLTAAPGFSKAAERIPARTLTFTLIKGHIQSGLFGSLTASSDHLAEKRHVIGKVWP